MQRTVHSAKKQATQLSIFGDCMQIRTFWLSLEKLINEQCQYASRVKISLKIIFFGVDEHQRTDTVFDFIVMLAQGYIYKCKTENNLPVLNVFLEQLNYRFKIEQYNATIAENLNKFEIEWINYKPLLEYTEQT